MKDQDGTNKEFYEYVKYAEKYIQFKDGYYNPIWETSKVKGRFIKAYTDALAVMLKLSGTGNKVLTYLINYEMGELNTIATGEATYHRYLAKVQEVLPPYKLSISRFHQAITELRLAGVIFRVGYGEHMIDPRLFDNGSKNARHNKIRMVLEFEAGSRTTMKVEHILDNKTIVATDEKDISKADMYNKPVVEDDVSGAALLAFAQDVDAHKL